MNDTHSYNQRSDGPTVDALELKLTGSTSLESDLKRTQDVEVIIRGTVVGHAFTDKYDKNGDVAQTVKSATVKVDELVEIIILTVPRRMKGQTAMNIDGVGHGADGEDLGDPVSTEAVIYRGEQIVDADVGPRPDGVDENGEVVQLRRHKWTDLDGDGLQYCEVCGYADSAVAESHACSGEHGILGDSLAASDEGEESELPPPAPVDRHPQVPESAWTTLNHEQKLDVAQRMERLAAQGTAIVEGRNSTDVTAATKHHEATVNALREDYGIELIAADEIEAADADAPEEPPPAPVSATSPPMSGRDLQRRRKYLLGKRGLPGEAEEARQEELAEIERRLGAQAAPA